MDKREAMLDIANIICENDENGIGDCQDCGANIDNTCHSKYGYIAKALYEAGYSKSGEAEIRKHIERGIALDIIDLIDNLDAWNNYDNIIEAIKERYKIDY